MKATIQDNGSIMLEPENSAERAVLNCWEGKNIYIARYHYTGGPVPLKLLDIVIETFEPEKKSKKKNKSEV